MDIIFVSLPKMEVHNPLIGPASLKAMVESQGFSAMCKDYNIELWNMLRNRGFGELWVDNDQTFMSDDFNYLWSTYIKKIVSEWIEELKYFNPKYIGITILSHWQYRMVDKFIDLLDFGKIILGGPGATKEYCSNKLSKNEIFAFVEGEGEYALLEILKGNLDYPGINGKPPLQIDNLDALPFPDYSDFDLSLYSHLFRNPYEKPKGSTWLYVTGSRGCIRKCTYCDVSSIWPKYKYKSGQIIVNEMKYQMKKYPSIQNFYFTDSLLNGNMKNLVEMATSIIDSDINVSWGGQFIVRSSNTMPQEIFSLLKKAGCKRMLLGVESASQQVLNHMKKGMRVDDIKYTVSQCSDNNISVVLMMMVGYPTETEDDFNKSLDMIYSLKKFSDNGTIFQLSLGPTARVYDGTPLALYFKDRGVSFEKTDDWVFNDNTLQVRIERWVRMRNICLNLGYKLALESPEFLKRRYKKITGKDLDMNK